MATDSDKGLSKDERIIREAKARHKRCAEREHTARKNFIEDMKFANADSYNGYQWPDDMDREENVALTINKARQHCLQIVNDARQNKAQIEIRATGNGSTYKAAEVFEGIVRHIEYISGAQAAYDTATWGQVFGGIGCWRVITDWADSDSFDQEIFIRRIPDPLSVYLDPDIQQYDGSDAMFGFVFKNIARDEFERQYPELKDQIPSPVLDEDGWCDEEHVREAEYYRVVLKKDVLVAIDDGKGGQIMKRKSDFAPGAFAAMPPETIVKQRDIETRSVEYYKIVGDKIIDRRLDYPGKYIPLVRVIGEEYTIDGKYDRRGHARALIDPQRIYNYWSSGAVKHVALQTKAPYLAGVRAIEGFEDMWQNPDDESRRVLVYNDIDKQTGQPIAPPRRAEPPVMAQAFIQGMEISAREMMYVTGQYQADFGAPSNETSGVAIQQRQRRGDNATYHYIDHLAQAIRYTGRIIVDLVPKIYDTHRVIQVLAMDGARMKVQVDPTQRGAIQQIQDTDDDSFDPDKIAAIFNPGVGEYDVEADIGPAFATRRQEAFNAFSQIVAQNASLMPIVGDLMFRAADFPMADDIAERLKNLVPPQALGGTSPQLQQMQAQHAAQMQQMQGTMVKMAEMLAEAKRGENVRVAETQIKEYQAETDRMRAVGGIDPAALKPIIREMVSQILNAPALPYMAAHAAADSAMAATPEQQVNGAAQ